MGLISWQVLSGLLNRKVIFILVLSSVLAGIFLYQKLTIEKLENKVANLNLQIKEIKSQLDICSSNNETFLQNIKSKDNVIKQLQKEIKDKEKTCQLLLSKKDKLISDLQKLKSEKPKDIKSTIIYKEKCSFKIETKEALNEKDFIFDTLNSIGK